MTGPEVAEAGDSSAAITITGCNNGIASTGRNANNVNVNVQQHVTQLPLPPGIVRAIADLPVTPHLSNVPPAPRTFTGRDRDLERLGTAFADGANACVLCGLGGVGKSALALHYAAADSATGLRWWISVDSPDAIQAGLTALGRELAPLLHGMLADVGGVTDETLRTVALQWLGTRHDWLLILDNVEEPSDVVPLLGRLTTGRVLMTSRRQTGWYDIATPVGIDVLDPVNAVALMKRITAYDGQQDVRDAGEVCDALGYLPLAIKQAASYMVEACITPRAYRDLLAADTARMIAARAEGVHERDTVAQTWRITLRRLSDTPTARRVLLSLAWYAAEAIPRRVVSFPGCETEFTEALRRLNAHSMVNLSGELVSVHRLVQSFSRTADPEDPFRQPDDVYRSYIDALIMLHGALPEETGTKDRGAWRELMPHIATVLRHRQLLLKVVDDSPEWTKAVDTMAAIIMVRVAAFHCVQDDYAGSIPYLTDALPILREELGPHHPHTVEAFDRLALSYVYSGQPEAAVAILVPELALREQALGESDNRTVSSRHHLGNAYRELGHTRRAIELLGRVRSDRIRLKGPDNIETINVGNSLAVTYYLAGDMWNAIAVLESLTPELEHVADVQPRLELDIRLNLANAYSAVGLIDRAIALYEYVVASYLRTIGADHRQSALAMHNLAVAYLGIGDIEKAAGLFEKVLAIELDLLGPDDPDVAVTRQHLAECRTARRPASNG